MFNKYQKNINHIHEIEKIFSADDYNIMTLSKKNRLYYIVRETFESDDKYVA
tara:strand:- start:229 stop:384 length:156 start_codon:yes stop_codon:yes gene_type:complete